MTMVLYGTYSVATLVATSLDQFWAKWKWQ